jgi:hypothetical protein
MSMLDGPIDLKFAMVQGSKSHIGGGHGFADAVGSVYRSSGYIITMPYMDIE